MHTVRVAIRVRFRHRSRSAPQGAEFFLPGERRGCRTRVACLRRAEAAARCGSIRNRKFILQNSIFNKYACPASAASIPPEASPQPSGRACFRAVRGCSPPPGGGCGLPIASQSSSSQNTSAMIGCGGLLVLTDRFCRQAFPPQQAAAGCRRLRRQIRQRMVRIQSQHRAAACEDPLEADLRDASCGPSPPEAAARRCLTASILLAASPQPSGRACDFREAALRQGAAAGCRSLRDRIYKQAFPLQQAVAFPSLYDTTHVRIPATESSAAACWQSLP